MADRYASLKQGLVGCWIPSVSGSGLLLPDLSGRGNNGALTNMDASDWVSSQYGRALDFDGVNDYVTTSDSTFDFTNKFSVAFWCNIASGRMLVTKGDMGLHGYGFDFGGFTAGQIEFLVIQNNANYINRGFANPGGWTHVVGMFDSSISGAGRNILFINGIQRTGTVTAAGTVNAVTTNSSNLIFGSYASLNLFLNGQLDDIRIYNRVLTESEIRLLASEPGIGFKRRASSVFAKRYTYQPPKAKVFEGVRVRDHDYSSLRQGLVGAWCPSLPNGGSGNTLPDQSGRGNHGTLTNMGPEDWVSSGDGRALDFDNTDDYVSCSSQAVQSLTSGTICFWLKTSKEVCAPFCIQQATSVNDSFQIGIGQNWTGFLTNELITVARVGSGSINRLFGYTTATRTELLDNQWHHVAIVASGSYAIYIDGVSKSLTFPGAYPTNDGAFTSGIASLSNLYIGGYRDGVDILPINGQMDDVRVYSRGLTESEIRLLASRRGIGLQPSPTRFIAREKKTGLRRKILTGQT